MTIKFICFLVVMSLKKAWFESFFNFWHKNISKNGNSDSSFYIEHSISQSDGSSSWISTYPDSVQSMDAKFECFTYKFCNTNSPFF